jgi:DnaJ-class molecular chaperone
MPLKKYSQFIKECPTCEGTELDPEDETLECATCGGKGFVMTDSGKDLMSFLKLYGVME